MTIEEAKVAIAKTKSPYLKRDLEKFIARQEKKSKRRCSQQEPERDGGGVGEHKCLKE